METVKLKPSTRGYIWGGKRLFNYGKESNDEIIAETWELSYYPGGECFIDSGDYKGKMLKDVATNNDLGKNIKKHEFFPILIKLIDANQDLSVQVHPSDKYALEHEHSYGKTEMWYVVEATEDAMLHIGFNKDVTKDEVEQRIIDGTILEVMNHIKVKPGDCYFIPSGTLHAIGKGCLVIEIQENSDLTYRVYDYGRVGKDGKPRELHIEKALKVTNYEKTEVYNIQGHFLANNIYFRVRKEENIREIVAGLDSFVTFTVIEGSGTANNMPFSKGDTFFIPAGKRASFSGAFKIIVTNIN